MTAASQFAGKQSAVAPCVFETDRDKLFKINLKTVAVMLCLVACISTANATLLAYEPFNYTLGAFNAPASTATGTPTATTGGGFSNWFSGGTGASIVTGLTYAGLPTANNALQWATSPAYEGENLTTAITPGMNGTVYVSFLYNAPSYTANKSGFAVDNGAGQNIGYYMGMTSSGTFGVATIDNGSGTVLGTATNTINFNTPYFIVVKFVKDSGGTYYQSGSIWINPTPGGSEPAASGTFTGTYTAMTKIADFLTALGGSTVIIDEVRMGTTWADVTPASASPPATPTGLTVTATGANSVSLSWTASTGSPVSYNVKRSTTSGGTYTTVGTTTAPTTNYTDTVVGGSTYYYEVSAVNVAGESANSSYVSAAPTLGAPSAPTGLAATPGNNQVSLSWVAPAVGSPTSYNVLRSTSTGTETSLATGVAGTSYTDATAANGTPYYYVVQAVNAAGTSGNSLEVSATPVAYLNAYEPFNYSSIAAGTGVTGTGLSGTWTAGANSLVAGLSYTGLPTANHALQGSANTRQFVSFANSLSSGTKYISFLLKTTGTGDPGATINGVYFPNGGTGLFFGFGFGANSGTQGRMGVGTIDTTGSTALNSATAKSTSASLQTYGTAYFIVLKIDFNTSGTNDTVTVYINPTANSADPGVSADQTVTTIDVGVITGIGLNSVQSMTVDEIRTGSSYSDVVGYVSVPPNAPTGLNATPGINLVSLSWTAATGSPSGYNIKRSTVSGGSYTNIGSTTAPIVNYNDSVLGGQTFYYLVSAVNGAGESTNSLPVSATPTLGAPAVPTGLAPTAGNAQVALSWTATSFATSYTVKRATVSGGPYSLVGTTTAPTVTYTDSNGLNNGTTYYYVVSATGAGGTSSDSSPMIAIPVGPMPFLISITPGVGITWFASNSVTYQVQWSSAQLGTNTVWNNLGSSITGSGATNTLFDPVGSPHNFFHVLSIQ
jgi:fibronectin type 3 domain-containing protein